MSCVSCKFQVFKYKTAAIFFVECCCDDTEHKKGFNVFCLFCALERYHNATIMLDEWVVRAKLTTSVVEGFDAVCYIRLFFVYKGKDVVYPDGFFCRRGFLLLLFLVLA